MSRRLTIGPFNRVEGDLEVTLDVEAGRVVAARVSSSLYRGFEHILIGRHPLDALVIVPRICGICSVSQSAAAAAALADAAGLEMPANGRLASNLILACENLADHLTHFYLFFMPDFARAAYRGRPWHRQAEQRFKATVGEALREVLPARADLLRLMGHLAGKWPHSLALQPGGTTRAVTATEKVRLLAVLRDFRGFLSRVVFGDTLENVSAIESGDALAAWASGRSADFARFVEIAADLGLGAVGRASDCFLSYGAYATVDAAATSAGTADAAAGHLFSRGIWHGGWRPLVARSISEDVAHSWLFGEQALHPASGETRPLMGEFAEKPAAYTWCKAPRYEGGVAETGALARQLVAGQPLLRALVAASGGSVLARVCARLLELALVVPAMERWVHALAPGQAFCAHAAIPDGASGAGLVEAARGGLGHWLRIEKGRIASYQIVAPTTWNFSPRDAAGVPGPLEQALSGLEVADGEELLLLVQHVVRSFDPCMVCTVH
ncbi:nickel-dependent hydrogenase large subunit [Accumulibacter sp.]|uniref:nickel-dependent hydrogenase large subunit n=1 Tax=Accumulibacter sp. TaxID=2053492 RepID=UPI0025D9E504|nr:nickel-dependent hydrogenase large subunit [Accumulibacter sp.]MCM8612263.1 nickel-dependent hydrogenase large subunit [Accumulibacter sp.]MCM8635936.1 nickel-dependent hydrogenase large subunit [Accumulibacter sp.]MCM8639455.1 nickel-dependent hydrogenase large subunit [Accumulibacter sp.]